MNTRIAFFAATLFTTATAAQQPQNTVHEIDGRLQWLAAQREEASNQAAALAGRLNDANAKLKVAGDEIERLKKLCGDACKDKPKEKSKER